MSVFLHPIYTQTVGVGGAGSVTFNNIPQNYTDLKILISSRQGDEVGARGIALRVNGSSQGYSSTQLNFANGSVTGGNLWGNSNDFLNLGISGGPLYTINNFSNNSYYISRYSQGAFKNIWADGVMESNSATSSYIRFGSGVWKNTDPVSSVTLFPFGFNGFFAEGSTFTLYGISNTFAGQSPLAPSIGTVVDEAGYLSVPFTPQSNDNAAIYSATTSPANVTVYSNTSPIYVPAALNQPYTVQVSAVNAIGSSASSSSNSITTLNNFSSIATFSLNGETSSVTFTNIPQNYKHLELRILAKTTRSGGNNYVQDGTLRFNDDSGAVYSYHFMYAFGGSAAGGATGQTGAQLQVFSADGDGAIPNAFAPVIVKISDYSANYKNKVLSTFGGSITTSSYVDLVAYNTHSWYSITPITSITVSAGNSLKANSRIALYGVS